MSFDPDEFLKAAQANQQAPAQVKPAGFDPNQFLEQAGSQPIADPFNYNNMRFFKGTKNIDHAFTPEQKVAFDNLDKIVPSDVSKESARAEIIGQNFAQQTLPGMPPSYLARNWPAVKEGYLNKFDDHTKNPSDEYFHNFLGDLQLQANYIKNYDPVTSPKPEPWKWDDKASMLDAFKYAGSQIFLHGLSDYKDSPPEKQYLPDETIMVDTENGPVAVNPAAVAGFYNGMIPFMSQFTTLKGGLNIISGEAALAGLGEIAKTSQVGKYLLTTADWGFGASIAYSFGKQAPERYAIITDSKQRLSDRVSAAVEGGTELAMTTASFLAGLHNVMKPGEYENVIKTAKTDLTKATKMLRDAAQTNEYPGGSLDLNAAADHLEELDKLAKSVGQPKPRIRVVTDAEGNVVQRPLTPEEEQAYVERNRPAMAKEVEGEPSVSAPIGQSVQDKIPEHQNVTINDLIEKKPDGSVGINNAAMDSLLESIGVDKPTEQERVQFDTELDKVVKGIEGGSINTTDVINNLVDRKTPPTYQENTILAYETTRLSNESKRLNNEINDARASGDAELVDSLQAQLNVVRDNISKIGHINKSTGTSTAQSLVFRKMMLKEDYSLSSLQRKFEEAAGRPPTEKEFKELNDASEQINKANEELDRASKKRKQSDTEESLARKKGRLLKQIDDLNERLSGKKPVKRPKRLERPEIEEIEKLSQERDRLSDELKIRNSTQDRIKNLEESIAAKRKQIAEGDLLPKPKNVNRPAVEAVEKLKQELEGLQKEFNEAKKQAVAEEKERINKLGLKPEESADDLIKKRARELDKLIEQKKSILERVGVTTKAELQNRPLPEILEEKTRQLEDLNKQISDRAKERGQDVSERIKKLTEKYQSKLESEDFTKAARKEYKLTPEQQIIQERLNNLKAAVNRRIAEEQFKAKRILGKIKTYNRAWALFRFISDPLITIKLTAIGLLRMGVTPFLNLGGLIGSKLPFKELGSENVPSFGAWQRSEAKALTATIVNGFPDLIKALYGENNEIESMLGEIKVDKGLNKYVGRLHTALQSLTRRNDFARRLSLLNERDMNTGAEMNPIKQVFNISEAWQESNRSRLTQDSVIANGWNSFIRILEKGDSRLGNFLAEAFKVDSPIVKMPFNLAEELNSYVFGILDPVSTLLFKGLDGFKDLNSAQTGRMMRNLKNGQVGLAVAALAFFKLHGKNVIQYGQPLKPGEKRSPKDPQPGELKIGNTIIPSKFAEHPLVKELEVWASTREILNDVAKLDKIHKHTPIDHIVADALETGEAFSTAYLEQLKNLPGIKENILSVMGDPRKSQRAVANMIAQYVAPNLISTPAALLDKKQPFNLREKPTPRGTIGRIGPYQELKEAIAERIPVLRQKLPVRNINVSFISATPPSN